MQNAVMIQFFQWYTPENSLWKEVKYKAASLAALGISSVWLPPAYKAASGSNSVGYDTYDLYDLGEFEQKGNINTKYGSREEYFAAINALHHNNIQVLVDAVLNHKAGGDETERIMAVKNNEENRNEKIKDPEEIEAYTKFNFPARKNKYSSFIWNYECFSGVDDNNLTNEKAIFKILNNYGDDWEYVIDNEKGNYDYLMYCDIEYRNQSVREEILNWAKWYHDTVGYDGFRLDAVKHITPDFYTDWLGKLRSQTGKELFAVGEYWAPGDLPLLLKYIEATNGVMSLFDASLHHNLHLASTQGKGFDMRTLLDDTLVKAMPDKAVTVTDNHDTQPLQALEAPVEFWFKPLAYALILLRQEGYPCIFYPDMYGCSYKDHGKDGNEYEIFLNKVEELEALLLLRKNNNYGLQRDYFDHANCIGWIREGDDEHTGFAVIMCNGNDGIKMMEIGKRYSGKIFIDALGKHTKEVTINEDGWAEFYCKAGSVSVWTTKQ